MDKEHLAGLSTEGTNPATENIDDVETLDMLRLINAEDKKVALAVEAALPSIARAVDAIAGAFAAGGRLVYMGAGTSGRLGVLDASECVPTFGVPATMVVGLIAGGRPAAFAPVEEVEDKEDEGRRDLQGIEFSARDILVGIAASGRTPYVSGGLAYARETGAKTVSLACVGDAKISGCADIPIEVITGPEAIAGSTRMKAGTAQKMVLNMLSTGAMIRIGKVYRNRMVDVTATNHKLTERALRMTCELAGAREDEARKALEAADWHVKLAVLMLRAGLPAQKAKKELEAAGGKLRRALQNSGGHENA